MALKLREGMKDMLKLLYNSFSRPIFVDNFGINCTRESSVSKTDSIFSNFIQFLQAQDCWWYSVWWVLGSERRPIEIYTARPKRRTSIDKSVVNLHCPVFRPSADELISLINPLSPRPRSPLIYNFNEQPRSLATTFSATIGYLFKAKSILSIGH